MDTASTLDTVRTRARQQLDAGTPLPQVLALLTSAAEALSPVQAHSSILLLDPSGLLRNGASPHLPVDYLAAIDRLRPHAGLGTCAAAAATGEVIVTESFLADAKWAELRHLPLAIGYRSAWSMPIKDESGTVLGTFGTYFWIERTPGAAEIEAVHALAAEAAFAVMKTRSSASK